MAKLPVGKLDVVIPVLHGSNGEDGIFEGVLETIGIPFAGCNTLSSANGMDKITMKMILQASGRARGAVSVVHGQAVVRTA